MSFKDITPGTKVGRPIGARFIEAKTGTIGIEVAFEFEEAGRTERLNWVGWLSPTTTDKKGALEKTMETLTEVLGFNGNDAVVQDDSGKLADPAALAYGVDVQLVVEMELNPENQKSYPRIRWVNKVVRSALQGLAPEIVKTKLSAVGFKAAYLVAKQAAGASAPRPQPAGHSALAAQVDIPF